jgi:hypothetical protein
MRKLFLVSLFVVITDHCFCWGFYGHKKINNLAIYLLPPEMMVLYKPNSDFLTEHAVDPDKRRYALPQEGARHFIDIDHYGKYPYPELPHKWQDAVAKFSEDTLQAYGIGPWWIPIMMHRLTDAFKEKNEARILKLSAELGHYIADLHVPLHACTNHNGQYSDQKGIHGFWESRLPELLADKEWDFFIGKAEYIKDPAAFTWHRVLESGAASDTVLRVEKQLSREFPGDQKFSFEDRNGIVIRQYSTAYSIAYDQRLKGMVERRMRQSIFAVASLWYTAWVNAGQPDLAKLSNKQFSEADLKEFEELNSAWRNSESNPREHE